eukprot:13682282-Alexandrium_andersonii.AAC.1
MRAAARGRRVDSARGSSTVCSFAMALEEGDTSSCKGHARTSGTNGRKGGLKKPSAVRGRC